MPHEVAFHALGFGLIWFSVLLVVMVLLISLAREYHVGQSLRGVFAFALAIIGLCAFIALGMISAKVQKANVHSTSFDKT